MKKTARFGVKWASLGLAASVLACVSASALATTVGDVATTVNGNLSTVPDVFSGAAYLTGAIVAVKSLMAFRDQAEDGGRTKLSKPIMLLVIATILLGLPGFLSVASTSMFGSSGTSTVVDHS